MNRIKRIFFLLIAISFSLQAWSWGNLGHDAVAHIAERNLTPRAKERIEKYLDGHSIVYYASWMDFVRATPEYKYSSPWHASDVNKKGEYYRSNVRDAVEGYKTVLRNLRKHKNLSDSVVAVNLKLFVHIVGDMHCPGHAFYTGYPQKDIYFDMNGTKMNVHTFWDDFCLEHHKWQFLEYGNQLDKFSDSEKKEMAKGEPEDWMDQTGKLMTSTYDWLEDGMKYNKNEMFAIRLKAEKIAHPQLVRAGYRLARILNEVFDY